MQRALVLRVAIVFCARADVAGSNGTAICVCSEGRIGGKPVGSHICSSSSKPSGGSLQVGRASVILGMCLPLPVLFCFFQIFLSIVVRTSVIEYPQCPAAVAKP